jgi:hypothetical protein
VGTDSKVQAARGQPLDDQRQVCIDVLCAYLRMPYEPDIASEKHREGDAVASPPTDSRPIFYKLVRQIFA